MRRIVHVHVRASLSQSHEVDLSEGFPGTE